MRDSGDLQVNQRPNRTQEVGGSNPPKKSLRVGNFTFAGIWNSRQTLREAARSRSRAGGTVEEATIAQVWPCWVQVTRVWLAAWATW